TRSSSEKPKQVQTEPEHAPGSLSGLDARVRKGSEGAAA
ncbi:site-specific DNA-methyltransferase, partial [Amycolatopsis balhimycina DSM 5908]